MDLLPMSNNVTCTNSTVCFHRKLGSVHGVSQRARADTALKSKLVFDISCNHITVSP